MAYSNPLEQFFRDREIFELEYSEKEDMFVAEPPQKVIEVPFAEIPEEPLETTKYIKQTKESEYRTLGTRFQDNISSRKVDQDI